MMPSPTLYEAALAFRKTKLWDKLQEDQMFAVALSNGDIGYCCVIGSAGEHLALALYPNDQSVQSLYRLFQPPVLPCPSILHQQEALFYQNCIQCSFESMGDLSTEEAAALRAYTKANHIALRGKNACPQFTKFVTAHPFFPVDDPQDETLLTEALQAGLAVAQRVREEGRCWLDIVQPGEAGQVIPLLIPTVKGFQWSFHTMPPMQPVEHPSPSLTDELQVKRLRQAKKSRAHWIFDVAITLVETDYPDASHAPYTYFPYLLLGVNRSTQETAMIPEMTAGYGLEQAGRLLTALGRWMLERGVPAQITVCDDRTYALLRGLADQLGIRLHPADKAGAAEIDLLRDAEDALAERVNETDGMEDDLDAELDMLVDFLRTADDNQLRTMPDTLWDYLVALAQSGLPTPELAQRILRLRR